MEVKQQAPLSQSPATKASEGTPSLLTVSPSPHARRGMTTASVMKDVFIALLPASIWGAYAFGWYAALILLVSVFSAVLFEMLTQIILKRTVTVADCSAAVTGLLIGLNLPSTVPLYVPVVGSAFAIIVVKQIFGGIGKNILNPALAARVFLMMAWSGQMSGFTGFHDAVAGATPLASVNAGVLPENVTLLDLFLGKTGGCIGEVSTLMLLVGGIYLLARRVIRWHIPVAMLGTVAILTFAFPIVPDGVSADLLTRATYVAASLCSGGLMLGAIFMATDYVTSPVTNWGRIIYGVGCGALVVFIRYFSGYPEGVSFAILIMNTLVWYLDMATKPRVFGKPRREKKSKA